MICRISRLQGAGIPILNAVYRFYPFRDCDILRDTASRSELSRRRRVTFKRVVGIEDDDALDRLVVCGSSVRHTRPGSPGCSGGEQAARSGRGGAAIDRLTEERRIPGGSVRTRDMSRRRRRSVLRSRDSLLETGRSDAGPPGCSPRILPERGGRGGSGRSVALVLGGVEQQPVGVEFREGAENLLQKFDPRFVASLEDMGDARRIDIESWGPQPRPPNLPGAPIQPNLLQRREFFKSKKNLHL